MAPNSDILADIKRFYSLINNLKDRIGDYHYLSGCNGRMSWPRRGVYFFFEAGEHRRDEKELRVVRVGTHAVSKGSKSTLWSRLRTHRGHLSGGGNHRGSVFRLLVGSAFINKNGYSDPCKGTWGLGNSASRIIRDGERDLEREVSKYISNMPFLWVAIDDEPGSESDRKLIERNAIALLSGLNGCPDSSSSTWLGNYSKSENVRISGLWNSDHVREECDTTFLNLLEEYIHQM